MLASVGVEELPGPISRRDDPGARAVVSKALLEIACSRYHPVDIVFTMAGGKAAAMCASASRPRCLPRPLAMAHANATPSNTRKRTRRTTRSACKLASWMARSVTAADMEVANQKAFGKRRAFKASSLAACNCSACNVSTGNGSSGCLGQSSMNTSRYRSTASQPGATATKRMSRESVVRPCNNSVITTSARLFRALTSRKERKMTTATAGVGMRCKPDARASTASRKSDTLSAKVGTSSGRCSWSARVCCSSFNAWRMAVARCCRTGHASRACSSILARHSAKSTAHSWELASAACLACNDRLVTNFAAAAECSAIACILWADLWDAS
mmetsp:Transcript_131366/g.366251  ORF Transcript_131366/g.366251 Transcript_131366/m.366251 type:complete len:329 (-) Transcript_131366:151-1137(-)